MMVIACDIVVAHWDTHPRSEIEGNLFEDVPVGVSLMAVKFFSETRKIHYDVVFKRWPLA